MYDGVLAFGVWRFVLAAPPRILPVSTWYLTSTWYQVRPTSTFHRHGSSSTLKRYLVCMLCTYPFPSTLLSTVLGTYSIQYLGIATCDLRLAPSFLLTSVGRPSSTVDRARRTTEFEKHSRHLVLQRSSFRNNNEGEEVKANNSVRSPTPARVSLLSAVVLVPGLWWYFYCYRTTSGTKSSSVIYGSQHGTTQPTTLHTSLTQPWTS